MQEFIIIDGLPYLYADGKAYAVRWDDEGFTLGEVFRDDISPKDFIVLSELSVKAKCERLDSIGVANKTEAAAPETEDTAEPETEDTAEPETEEEPKPKRGRKAKGDSK